MSPIGFALYYTHQNNIAVFFVNFLAIVPPAFLLNFAVDQLTLRLGDVVGCIIGFTFGNAVQLISSILLLKSRQVALLQSSLLGSMLANLLLMTGLSFFVGGFGRYEQFFHAQVAQTIGMFLLLAVLSLPVPTTAHFIAGTSPAGIRAQSRATSILIIISYALRLYFQLKTNRRLFGLEMRAREPPAKAVKRPSKSEREAATSRTLATMGAGLQAVPGNSRVMDAAREEEENDSPRAPLPQLSLITAIVAIVMATTFIGFNTEFATNSVNAMLQEAGLPESFVGLIILPLLSVDPLCIKAALGDKMDVSLALTLERCMQTALFVTPLIVLLAWCIGVDDMTLEFSAFSVAALFASIFIVTYVIQEGRSNWLTGVLLIKVYIIIAISSFYVPQKQDGSLCSAL